MPFCCSFTTSVTNMTPLACVAYHWSLDFQLGLMRGNVFPQRKLFYIPSTNNTGTFNVLHSYHCISLYQKPLFQSLTINKGKMILTYGLKYNLRYVKGFSNISSKSIERLQKRWEIGVILMDCRAVHLPYKNIFYGPWSSAYAVVMKRVNQACYSYFIWE